MTVKQLTVFLLLSSFGLAVSTTLSQLETLRKLDAIRNTKHGAREEPSESVDSKSFMNEYSKKDERELSQKAEGDRKLDDPNQFEIPDGLIDKKFETKEIMDAINFIYFKIISCRSFFG